MDVLGNGGLRGSFRKLRQSQGQAGGGGDGERAEQESERGIFHQTFTHHWLACRDRIHQFEPHSVRSADDILTVTAQLQQMLHLLQLELGATNNNGETRILDTILSDSDNILAQIVGWAKSLPLTQSDSILRLLLQFSEILVGCRQSGQSVLSHTKILQPLLALLDIIKLLPQTFQPSPELQSSLLGLVHALCVLLMESPHLLDLFTSSTTSSSFLLFSLLTPFLHRPDSQGQQARDSLLLLVSLSSQHENMETFISDHSNFCPILATGLSGLYSSLPRSLPVDSPSWHRLDPSDGQDMQGLGNLLTSLELCSAVLQVAPVKVKVQLLDLMEAGFLVPVIGPALVGQSDTEAIVASTAYVDLFLRVISSPPLLATWVRFIMTSRQDNKLILDVLISRISSSGQTCIVTLQLFETLVSLNMEDVMVALVLRHLVPCTFLLPSFRSKLNFLDPHGRAAHKLLSLVPVSCDPPATPLTPRRKPFTFTQPAQPPSSQSQSYAAYLADAQSVIRQTYTECRYWTNSYDGAVTDKAKAGVGEVRDHARVGDLSVEIGRDPLMDSPDFPDTFPGSGPCSLGDTSGYLSLEAAEVEEVTPGVLTVQLSAEEEQEFWSAVGYEDGRSQSRQKLVSALAKLQHEDRLSMSSHGSEEVVVSPRSGHSQDQTQPAESSAPTLGPFLTSVLARVGQFPDNGLAVNLRLTALVSKLATYPQPLLKAVLLHPDLVVQPSCSTLIQAICTARQRIDSVMPGLLGAEEAVRTAREDLASRLDPHQRSASTTSIISLPASLDMGLRRGSSSLMRMFSSRRTVTGLPPGPTSLTSSTELRVPPHTRKMAMAAVLLEEWLQELASLAQEHSVLLQQESLLHPQST